MSSTDELDPPSITECSTASIESGSVENENTSNSNTVKNFIPVYVYNEISNPSTQKTLSFPTKNAEYFTNQRKTFLQKHAPSNDLSVKPLAFKKAVDHDKEKSMTLQQQFFKDSLDGLSDMSPEEACSSFLAKNSIWRSREDVYHAVNYIGSMKGFSVRFEELRISCSLAGHAPKERQGGNSHRDDCPFRIVINPLYEIPKELRNRLSKNEVDELTRQIKYQSLCVISKCEASHNHPCDAQNRHECDRRSGNLSSKLNPSVLFTLLQIVMGAPQLDPQTMRGILKAACPPGQHWDARQLDNLRKRLRKMGEDMKSNDRLLDDMDHFLKQFQDDTGFFDGMFENEDLQEWGDKILFDINDFYKHANTATFGKSEDSGDNRIIVNSQMYKLSDENFDFSVGVDEDDKIVGIFWQTGAQRAAFDRYGSTLCADGMGRVTNTQGWKICSLCVRDEHGKMHRAGDLLYYFDESSDGFLFGIDSLLDMSNRTRESILVFSGDLFFNQKMITEKFNLPNAVFVPDQWHLIKAMKDQIHEKYLRDTNGFFQGMVYAKNENEFKQASHSFMEQMKKNGANNDHIDWVKKNLINKETRHNYSQFELNQIKGTLNFHGSTVCEQNHSSIVSQLGVGYYEEPHKLQKDLIEMTKLAQHNLYTRLTKERRELTNLNRQARNSILQASTKMVENESLNLAGYKHFESEFEKSCYFCKETLDDGKIKIHNINFPENFVIFDSNEDRCTCSKSVAMMIQCRHEIVLCNNVYDPSRFDIRWKYMSKATLAKRKAHREEYYLPSEDVVQECKRVTSIMERKRNMRISSSIARNTAHNEVCDSTSRSVLYDSPATDQFQGEDTTSDSHDEFQGVDTTSDSHDEIQPSDILEAQGSDLSYNTVLENAKCLVNTLSNLGGSYLAAGNILFNTLTKNLRHGSEVTASTLLEKGEKLAKSLVPSVRIVTNISENTSVNNVTNEFSRTGRRTRITSAKEKAGAKKKPKKAKTCDLCGSNGHNKGRCPSMKFGIDISVDHMTRLKCQAKKGEDVGKLSTLTDEYEQAPDKFLKRSHHYTLHCFVTKLESFSGEIPTSNLYAVMSQLEFEPLTNGEKLLKPDEDMSKKYVSFAEFEAHIRAMTGTGNTGKRRWHVFDNIKGDVAKMIQNDMKIVTSQPPSQQVVNSAIQPMQMSQPSSQHVLAFQPMQMSQSSMQQVVGSHVQMSNAIHPMHTMHMSMSQFPMFPQNGLSQQSYQHFGYGPSLSQQPPQFQILSQPQYVNGSDMFPQDQDMSGDEQS
ncbi:hypothetical protein CTEN210_00726 [Chaetoceros tenuissimus]|uniref:SWIM-type domain-containing protein n=1 Tax=Chaetoceros tenuissimus TaxID=426638 RepID=A0AAD3GYP0_9STRA|nr:hypothetical protein CTEN210_00726 [Chaetoceros tenuissimus]